MAKWVFNNSGSDKTWVGQLVADQAYYQIQSNEEIQWANDDALISDIGSGDAIVSSINANSGHYGISDGINHLKDMLDIPLGVTGIKEPKEYRARLIGTHVGTATKNSTTDFDYQMQQLSWLGTNKKSYFDGVMYYAKNAEVGDHVSFQVVDVDGIAYPSGTVLEEFASNWYVVPDVRDSIRLFKSSIAPGMYIRVKYHSTGTVNDVGFMCNLFRFLKADEDA